MFLKSYAAKHGRHPLIAHPAQGKIWAADRSGGLAVLHLFRCIETCCTGTDCCALDTNATLQTFQILSRPVQTARFRRGHLSHSELWGRAAERHQTRRI